MPVKDLIDAVNPGPFGSTVTNFAAVKKTGETLDHDGETDFTKSKPEEVSGSTMFGEGSIGKVRYAGLAYMLEEEKTIDLSAPAGKFFASEKMGEFLEKKYPGQGTAVQAEIAKLFSGKSSEAKLSDLTTHRSGIGDLTRDQARLAQSEGLDKEYSVADLLLIPKEHRGIPRDEVGKPRRQSDPFTPDENLPEAEYGKHEYSNLGYMLLGLAMEAAYDAKKNPQGEHEIKDYKQLVRDYMLHPIEGPACGKGLSFDQTKFPEDLTIQDDVARGQWLANGRLIDTTQFSGANAAGGMFVSADDSKKFFTEFFAGFPGTPEAENKFFSKETIQKMFDEGARFPESCGATKSGNQDFQMPGFVVEKTPPDPRVPGSKGEALCFKKGGGTFGYASFLTFDLKANHPVIDMCAQENITGEVAKKRAVEKGDVFVGATAKEISDQRVAKTAEVVEEYRDPKSEKLDRREMITSEMPKVALQIVAKEMAGHVIDDVVASSVAKIAAAKTEERDFGR